MTRVLLGKTAKENSRDMEGGLPDSSEGWPGSAVETKTSRRRVRFSAITAALPVELWVQVNMCLFFFSFQVIAKNYLETLWSVSVHCSLGRKNWISTAFPHRMLSFRAVLRAFCCCCWMNRDFWIGLKNKRCIMHYADCALWIIL